MSRRKSSISQEPRIIAPKGGFLQVHKGSYRLSACASDRKSLTAATKIITPASRRANEPGLASRDSPGGRTREAPSDIQGLRAVAVLLVVLDHAGLPFVQRRIRRESMSSSSCPAILITGMLLRQARRDGTIRLTDFYVRRARRILPAAVLTLVVTSIAAHQLLNFVRARSVVEDSIWAAFFVANVHFARAGKRLLRAAAAAFADPALLDARGRGAVLPRLATSLSLVLFGALLGRRLRLAAAPGRCRSVGLPSSRLSCRLAGLASLAWSIHSRTATDGRVLLDPHACMGAGSRRGARGAAPRLRRGIPAACRSPWAGRGSAPSRSPPFSFSDGTAFPGYAALLPAVGAALVIAAGFGGNRALDVGRILSPRAVPLRRRPLVRLLPLALAGAGHRGRVRGP